jgi:hypothetical protein
MGWLIPISQTAEELAMSEFRMLSGHIGILLVLVFILLALAITVSGCGSYGPYRHEETVLLTGAREVPPVETSARGVANIAVGSDHSVSGSVKTYGLTGTAVQIHTGAAGENGPAIVPLTNSGAGTWTIPVNAILTEEQFSEYQNGRSYVNVQSDEHPGGEIRTQLGPP